MQVLVPETITTNTADNNDVNKARDAKAKAKDLSFKAKAKAKAAAFKAKAKDKAAAFKAKAKAKDAAKYRKKRNIKTMYWSTLHFLLWLQMLW